VNATDRSDPFVRDLKARTTAAVDDLQGDLIALSHRIHAHPETAFKEEQAATWLCDMLRQNGLSVETGIGGLPTAFRATASSGAGGPTVAILGEYDALPEIGHGCGHNIMGTAAVGAGIALRRVMGSLNNSRGESLGGTALVIGTPAEEGGGGKVILLNAGVFAGVDAAMIVHPASRTMVTRSSLASNRLVLEFFGKSAHAASTPFEGINALDACILTFVNINALRQHVTSDVRIHGIITSGGAAVNIVPEYTSAAFSVRAADRGAALKVMARVVACAEAGAAAAGARVKATVTPGYDNIRPNRALAAAFKANMEELGEPVLEPRPDEKMGSTDMGNVSWALPAIHPYMAIVPETVAGHSRDFCLAAASPAGDRCLLLAAKAMAATAVDLFTDPALLARVKAEFAAA
jgi:amidohydrolase